MLDWQCWHYVLYFVQLFGKYVKGKPVAQKISKKQKYNPKEE